MRSSLGPVAAFGCATMLFACTELRHAEGETMAAPAAPASEGDVTPTQLVTPEEVAPKIAPTDRVCAEAWTVEARTDSGCTPRQVRLVDPDIALEATDVSIARTPAGRVGIVYNAESTSTSGAMRLATFTPSAPAFAAPKLTVRAGMEFAHLGHATRIAASAPDTLHVLAHDVQDIDGIGDLRLFELAASATGFSPPELVVPSVRRGAELGLAVDPSGTTFVSARITSASNKTRLAAFRQIGSGAYETLPDLASAILPQGVAAAGATSLHLDASGRLHALYQTAEFPGVSNPRYHTFDGKEWSYRKTLDNPRLEGIAGYSPRIATSGNKKLAAYFFRRAGQTSGGTAELRLATWEGADDTPEVQILVAALPADDERSPQYRVAMGVDGFGLVHLALVVPTGEGKGRLEYRRQVLVAGSKSWLTDTIDDDVLSVTSDALVDLVLDDGARPHITYRSGKDLRVRYATRFDR
jgi:hypothetical protein